MHFPPYFPTKPMNQKSDKLCCKISLNVMRVPKEHNTALSVVLTKGVRRPNLLSIYLQKVGG